MKLFKFLKTFLLNTCILVVSGFGQSVDINKIIKDELSREFQVLSKQEIPVYYLSYTYMHMKYQSLSASNGVVNPEVKYFFDEKIPHHHVSINLTVGSPELDQTREIENIGHNEQKRGEVVSFHENNDRSSILQEIWLNTHQIYEKAVNKYKKILVDISAKKSDEKRAPDFLIEHQPVKYFEDTIPYDKKGLTSWIPALQRLTNIPKGQPDDIDIRLTINNILERKSFYSSQGDDIVQNFNSLTIDIIVSAEDSDGEDQALYARYIGNEINKLPSEEVLRNKINVMIELIKKIKIAPKAESYSGPAIMSGEASGVYFHEIIGHRVEAHRLKEKSDAQIFKDKLGTKVFPEFISIDFDPTIKEYADFTLTGHYKYDDEGTKSEKVTVINKGILQDFLRSRRPIDEKSKSNGHGRSSTGYSPVSRQSNMIIKSENKVTDQELRSVLIQKLKKNKQEFGYFIQQVAGGYTSTIVYMPNFFEVRSTLAYKVFADGRPDQLVKGVRMIGTPLLMLSQIRISGDTPEIFSGFCGAESGTIPVTTISPSLLFENIEIQRPVDSRESPKILPSPIKLKDKNVP